MSVELSSDLEDPFQRSELGDGGSLHDSSDQKAPVPLDADAGLKCMDSSWTTV
jgi:hypothetical protein